MNPTLKAGMANQGKTLHEKPRFVIFLHRTPQSHSNSVSWAAAAPPHSHVRFRGPQPVLPTPAGPHALQPETSGSGPTAARLSRPCVTSEHSTGTVRTQNHAQLPRFLPHTP